jgi:hypothetical protein
MKNHCENPGYDVTQGQVICHDSGTFNKIVGEALADLDEHYPHDEERKLWLATVDLKGKPCQVQLVVTLDGMSFIDEN